MFAPILMKLMSAVQALMVALPEWYGPQHVFEMEWVDAAGVRLPLTVMPAKGMAPDFQHVLVVSVGMCACERPSILILFKAAHEMPEHAIFSKDANLLDMQCAFTRDEMTGLGCRLAA